MITELIKLSDHLDKLGLTKEADYLDTLAKRATLNKTAQESGNLEARVAELEKQLQALKDIRPLIPHVNALRNVVREGNVESTLDLMRTPEQQARRGERITERAERRMNRKQ